MDNFFEINLSHLKKFHPYLNFNILEKNFSTDSIEIVNSRGNSFSFKIGKITFHSLFDPVKEGQNFYESNKGGLSSATPIIFGTAFFFHIRPFLTNNTERHFILTENQPSIFIKAMTLFDLTDIFSRNDITFIIEDNPLNLINQLQKYHHIHPIFYPPYLKVYKQFYNDISNYLINLKRESSFEKLKYPKFKNSKVAILLITSKYFLMGEIINALKELDIPFDTLILSDQEFLSEEFIKLMIEKISSFHPDFIFTINHLGVDREGVLINFLEKIEMPLLSWYVDNPNLIIKHFKKNVSDIATLLVWDKDNIEDMKNIGFKNVFYLPLGVDTNRFKKIPINENKFSQFKADVIFIGNSMIEKVKKSYERTNVEEKFLKYYKEIAYEFSLDNIRSVEEVIKVKFPSLYKFFSDWDDTSKTNYETTVTWEATRIYRYNCVKEILNFDSLIVGDIGWRGYFNNKTKYHREINYYDELPYFYNLAEVNFNTTSLQMKNAVNQRVFDVPASKQFLITDYRSQIEDLFDIGKEVVCYKSIQEIEELISKYMKDKRERKNIINRAYKKVVEKHRYTQRVKDIIEIGKKIYSE